MTGGPRKPISPFFIVAVDRSGTTLLSSMLDTHSKIAIPYESKFITEMMADGRAKIEYSQPEKVRQLVAGILESPYVAQWDRKLQIEDLDLGSCRDFPSTVEAIYQAYALKRGKTIWGDKDPLYAGEVDVLYRLFPQARFVFLVRDGRDVASSILQRWWGPLDFINCIRYWERLVILGHKMLSMLPSDSVHYLRYEDLVSDPEGEIRSLCHFLGISYEKKMVTEYATSAFSKIGERRQKSHHRMLGEPINSARAYLWKTHMSRCDQAIAYEIAGPLFDLFGYESGHRRCALKPLRKVYHWLLQSFRRRIGGFPQGN